MVLLLLVMVGLPALFIRVNGFDPSPAVLERAVLARGLARGGGYVAAVVRPAFFAPGRGLDRQPALHQLPLYPVLLSLFFRFAGDADRAVVAFSLLSFWLAGLVLVLAVGKFFDLSSAFLCGLFYFSSALLLGEVVSGSPLFLEVLLLTLVLLLAVRPLMGLFSYLLLGLLLGLGCLAATPWLGIAALVLVYRLRVELAGAGRLSRRKAALKVVVGLGVGLAVVNLPWWLFRWLARGGSPLFFYPGLRSFTSSSPGPAWWREVGRLASFPTPRQLLAKWRETSRLVYENWLVFSGAYLAPFFWLSLLWRFKDARRSRLRFFVFACLLVFALEFLLGDRRPENLLVLVPWALALGAVVFNRLRLLVPRSLFSRVVLLVFVAVNLYPFLSALRFTKTLSPPPLSRRLLALGPALPERAVLVSDAPSEVAWYAGKPAVWLPAEVDYLSALAADRSWKYYLFLTPAALEHPSPRGRPSWPEVYRGGGYSPFWKILGVEEFAGGRLLVEIAFN